MEESIYNLIPKEYVPPAKQPLYRSKYSHQIPPTGSTFGHHTTSVPKVSNIEGYVDEVRGPHTNKGAISTFGHPRGRAAKDPQTFTKKNTGTMGRSLPPLSDESQFKYQTERKPAVPKKDEKPILGLVSKKNFITANAVENILSQAKTQEAPVDYMKKEDFGKVPRYLQNAKDNINREYDHIRTLQRMEDEQKEREKFLLAQDELKELREGLKRKWQMVNKEYQQITHISKIDTVGLKRRKENCEKELAQLEKDLEKLNKGFIFVDTTA